MYQQAEQGTVVDTLPSSLAKVKVARSALGHEAGVKGDCCEPLDSQHMLLVAENSFGAEVGQNVVVEFTPAGRGKAVGVLYLIPLAALILGAIAGHKLSLFGSPDGSATLLGLAFLVASFLGIAAYNRKVWAKDVRLQPKITGLLNPPGEGRKPGRPGSGARRPRGNSCPHCQ